MKIKSLLIIFILFSSGVYSQTLAPNYFKLIKVADSLFNLQEYKQSLVFYEKSEKYNPFPETYFYMSYAYYRENDEETACKYMRKAIDKGFYQYWNDYVKFLVEKDGCISKDYQELLYKNYARKESKGENEELRDEFIRRKNLDQQYRNTRKKTDEEWAEQKRLDSLNMVYLDSVLTILQCWPGTSELGEDCESIPFLIATHSDNFISFQEKCMEHAYQALLKNNIPRSSFAMLYDRVRVNKGEKQLFGTQLKYIEGKYIPHDLENEELVDIYRVYFELPLLKQYIEDMLK
ncbi:hypothetical protein LJC16_03685 [Bacteroidales bacterium OttesenSCG-928-C19]|nr:hypothetical protein [Bacteroidales bacterium OttesenSCG-928-C19]